MIAIVFNKSLLDRVNSLFLIKSRASVLPAPSQVVYVSDDVYFFYDSLLDLSRASIRLHTSGILHCCTIR